MVIDVGTKVYFARVVPQCDIYETLELTVRTASDAGYFIGVDSIGTKQAYPFIRDNVGSLIFSTEKEAKEVVKEAKKKYGTRKLTKVTEGEDD